MKWGGPDFRFRFFSRSKKRPRMTHVFLVNYSELYRTTVDSTVFLRSFLAYRHIQPGKMDWTTSNERWFIKNTTIQICFPSVQSVLETHVPAEFLFYFSEIHQDFSFAPHWTFAKSHRSDRLLSEGRLLISKTTSRKPQNRNKLAETNLHKSNAVFFRVSCYRYGEWQRCSISGGPHDGNGQSGICR